MERWSCQRRSGIRLILRSGREIEEPDGKAPFIQAINNDWHAQGIGAEGCVLGGPPLARLARRGSFPFSNNPAVRV